MHTSVIVFLILVLVIVLVIIILVLSKTHIGSLSLPEQPIINAPPTQHTPNNKKWNKTPGIWCYPKNDAYCPLGNCGATLALNTKIATSKNNLNLEDCKKLCSSNGSSCLLYNDYIDSYNCQCVGSCPSNGRKDCKSQFEWDMYRYGYPEK